MGLFLYSTQPFLKHHVNTQFLAKKHYVWCSEVFDGRQEAKLNISSTLGKSANPAEIYDDLRQFAKANRADRHCDHITRWKTSIPAVAVQLRRDGKIDDAALAEITFLVQNAEATMWRPLLYVIDRRAVGAKRVHLVAPDLRAGVAPEYIVNDLDVTEFDVLEF